MKKTAFAFIVSAIALSSMVSIAVADEFIGFDGCYQLYRPGSLYPVVCISGSAEEGISGAGVRVVSVGPNSTRVSFCRRTASSGMAEYIENANRSFYKFADASAIQSIQFNGKVGAEGREEGTVTITELGQPVTLDYMKLKAEQARRAMKAFDSEMCRKNGIN